MILKQMIVVKFHTCTDSEYTYFKTLKEWQANKYISNKYHLIMQNFVNC